MEIRRSGGGKKRNSMYRAAVFVGEVRGYRKGEFLSVNSYENGETTSGDSSFLYDLVSDSMG